MITPDPTTIPDPLVTFFVELGKEAGKQVWGATAGKAKKEGGYALAARRYRDEIVKQYDQIHIYGQARPSSLLDIFTEVHVLSKPLAMQRYNIDNLQEWFRQRDQAMSLHHREERRPGLAMLDEIDKLFILGKPGAGKTTFLKYLAVWAAKGHVDLPYIPIFISLKEYSDSGEELMDFIERQFAICDFAKARPFIERLLEKGKALMLFDGLDEVGATGGRRSQVIDNLRDFARQYGESTEIITCRVAASDYTFEGFTYVEMADFTPEQVESFVVKWFWDDEPTRTGMLADLGKPEHKGILELTHTPLLLTLLCIAYEETLSFPARRVEVYEDALDALLRKWDTSRKIKRDEVYRKLSLGRKRQMLARIAHETFSRGEYFVPQRKLEKQIVSYLARVPEAPEEVEIDGEAVLRAIAAQHGLLVERSQRIFSFSHLTFQEYFTAKYIADNEARGSLDELMTHVFDDPWREVFLLVASLLDDADDFFARFVTDLNRYAVQNDLSEFLRWANEAAQYLQKEIVVDAEKRNRSPLHYNVAAIRSWVIYLARDLARDHVLARDLARDHVLARDLARDHVLDRVRDLDLDLARDLTRDRVRDLDLARDRVLALDLNLLLDRDRDLNRDRDLDRDLDRASAEELKLDDFSKALNALKRPRNDAPIKEWQAYAKQLQAVIAEHRPSALVLRRVQQEIADEDSYPKLTDKQWRHVADYLKGVRLLLDCLDVAYVSNRKAIEDRLLLPPNN